MATRRLCRTYNNSGMLNAGVEALHSAILFLTPSENAALETGVEGLASLRTERALASLSPAAAARIGLSVSVHLLDLGQPQRGYEMIELAERYAHMANDSYTASHARSFRGDMLAELGRFTEAVTTWQDAVEMARHAGNLDMLVSTLLSLSYAQIARGQLDEAQRYAQEALDITTIQLGDLTFLIDSRLTLGEIDFIRGEWQNARTQFEQAWAIAGSTEHRRGAQ
jgi:tetratricopeptide (TPR) repeat protein